MQLKSLWDFQQVDMNADKFEADMKKSPNRQKYAKSRNFLIEQQGNMKKIESELAIMQDRLEAVRDEATRLEGVLKATIQEIEADPPKTAEDAERKIDAVKKLSDSLGRYEQELQKMRKDADTRDRQQRDIRVRAGKAKQEYDQIKAIYDKEFNEDKKKLADMRADIEKEAAKLDPKLLARYRDIKQHCTPPIARLSNGQCCGCFMQLPSATLRKVQEGENIVECDNCGRILYCDE